MAFDSKKRFIYYSFPSTFHTDFFDRTSFLMKTAKKKEGEEEEEGPTKVFIDFSDKLCPHLDTRLTTYGGFFDVEGDLQIVAVTIFGENEFSLFDEFNGHQKPGLTGD